MIPVQAESSSSTMETESGLSDDLPSTISMELLGVDYWVLLQIIISWEVFYKRT